MAKNTVLHAQLQVKGCVAELYLNDIPLTRVDAKVAGSETRPVEEYIVPGSNRLEILVEPGSRPSLARTEQRQLDVGDATAVARLVRFRDGEWTDAPGEVLGEVRFARPETFQGQRVFPQGLSIAIELGAANGHWDWQDAPELEMGEPLIAEATGVLEALARALRSASMDNVWPLKELEKRDVVRAYPGLNESDMRSTMAEGLAHYAKLGDPVVPLDRESFDFRLIAGGRMLECVNADWTPSLRLLGPDTGLEVPYKALLARIDGRLRVVR